MLDFSLRRSKLQQAVSKLLVFEINVVNGGLYQALHHGIEANAARGLLRNPQHTAALGTNFHLQFLVAGSFLLGGVGVDDFVAHTNQPNASAFLRLH